MRKNKTYTTAFEIGKQAIRSAKRFLDSDTPAANATQVVLALIVLSPIVFVGAMAPNVFQALRPYTKKRSYSVREVGRALDTLDRSKYLDIKRLKGGKVEIHITRKGMSQARKLSLETVKLSPSPEWNGKWHLLFYDVPVEHNSARLAFRNMVEKLGMYSIQKSLWVYPYSCEAEILFVADFFDIARCVNFAVADSLFDEDRILKFFKLTPIRVPSLKSQISSYGGI
ncbi:MAG: hypothetical protein COV91_01335 [Candidatus Taylorbacteria bacterium CG11_big_fil_rev_8_21_14_0_20_46_11]|uniref:Transcriptional repressor PaaX-like central Cas2-like domain-containing protein n=1 Tax=Candidatus Taylorbacteria bacterium CG11_big_fil_rev_8_21_14_0_20_46_11 TaxID=1975025 RepID=A0A2H0KCH9_9BACT|nr:MAG: hypothetical protein COV91_01335 [Candidatus Taylorbacteria bacterium CG11_big_fil_rev_8_21_14_0_20_46_11]